MQEHLGPCDPGGFEALMRLKGSSVYLSRQALVQFLSASYSFPRFCLLFKETELIDLNIKSYGACNAFSFVNMSHVRHLKNNIIVIVVVIYILGLADTHIHTPWSSLSSLSAFSTSCPV